MPPTPSEFTTHPKLDKAVTPVAITHTKAASGLQTLPGGKILFSQSSFTSPNDAYVATNLKSFETALLAGDKAAATNAKIDKVTSFTEDDLKNKNLDKGEEFWFKGALDKDIQGWALKPKGWQAGDKKKWPGLLLIHGGSYISQNCLNVLFGRF